VTMCWAVRIGCWGVKGAAALTPLTAGRFGEISGIRRNFWDFLRIEGIQRTPIDCRKFPIKNLPRKPRNSHSPCA
jgi:hypothetical protein